MIKLEEKVKKNEILYKDLGLAYLGMGKLEKALVLSDKSLEQNQKYIEAFFLKGQTLREMGNYDDAIKEFDKILQDNPKHRDALYQKGKIFHVDFNLILYG